MSQYFATDSAAQRYDRFRPKVQEIVLDWIREHCGNVRFQSALDVACGAGDSTLPLLTICDCVLGVDSSEVMLAIAQKKGLTIRKADYSEIATLGKFDLISTCMAFHWFDCATAIKAYKAASLPGAIWVIYNFAFGGHSTNTEFNRWFTADYLKRYPSPARSNEQDALLYKDKDLTPVAKGSGWLPLELSADALCGYLTTQSNIECALQTGVELARIQTQLREEFQRMNLSGAFKYAFSYDILKCAG